MKYRLAIFILLFYFLILLQNSFFAHLGVYGAFPNFALVMVCLISFFFSQRSAKPGKNQHNKYAAIFLIIIAGFLMDIFSQPFFGLSIVSFLIVYFFMKKCVDELLDVSREYQIFYFLPLFIISLFIYNLAAEVPLYFLGAANFYFFTNINFMLANAVYNLVAAALGFYIYSLAENGFKKI
jgi:hypothetical protein